MAFSHHLLHKAIGHIIVHPGPVIRTDRCWGIKESCQQILIDVPDTGRIIRKALQNVFDMAGIQLHEPAFYHFGRLLIAADQDSWLVGAAGIHDQIQNTIENIPFPRIALLQEINFKSISEIFLIGGSRSHLF